ncbi:MAG: CaiB/BaiF CoA-transferase family protein [Granulosicoccaceae bacterium]
MGALDGTLVVSIEQAVAAPLCTARMADAGARVIKIERAAGDFARAYDSAASGDSSYFVWANHSKESLVLNFKQADDAALLHRILNKADVLVQNLSPGALARAGFDAEKLQQLNPQLICCEISGYGESPAASDLKAYDLLVQAESGLVAVSGGGRIGISLCDIGAGITAYTGILEAIIARSNTGKGSTLKVSLFDVAAEWMSVPYVHAKYGAGAPPHTGLSHPSIAPYGAFETNDGLLTLISIQNEQEWARLAASVLSLPGLLDDDRYSSNSARVQHRDSLEASMSAAITQMSAEQFRAALGTASIAYGAVNSVDELIEHVALRSRQISNNRGDLLTLPAHPVQTGHSVDQCANVPTIGAHSESIRREFAVD